MSWKKELLGLLCLLLALALFCSAATAVLLPKRYDYGAVWGMYQKEPEDSVDVLFFGSSLVYCDVVPAVIYEETGITSFVMAGPDQRFPITYRYLREACKTQSPKAVFIEATPLLLSGPSNSLKVNLTYMPWTENRLIPTFQEADPADRAGLLFPLSAYHDRWDKLHWEDLSIGLLGYEADPLAGYTFLDRADPMGAPYDRGYEIEEEEYLFNLAYAEKMIGFCREQDIVPVFFLSPSIHQPSREWKKRMEKDLTGLGAEYINCNQELFTFGLDFSTDFFDPLHFNYRGAEKFSRYFSRKMVDLGLSPTEKAEESLWQERMDAFAQRKAEWDGKPVRKAEGASPQTGGPQTGGPQTGGAQTEDAQTADS